MLRESTAPWVVQQELREHAPIVRRFRSSPVAQALGRIIYEPRDGDGTEHALIEVDIAGQQVDFRMPGAKAPYAAWPLAEYLQLTRRQLDELYL